MPQSHPTLAVVTTKLSNERLAQLDRLARRRGVTRYRLVRTAIETLLDEADEPLTEAEQQRLRQRRFNVEAAARLGQINRRLGRSLEARTLRNEHYSSTKRRDA